MKHQIFLLTFSVCILANSAWSQPVPSIDENIPFLVTFGKEANKSWGDDDNCQIFFFMVPANQKEPVYIRVYDPDIGGKFDEQRGVFNTKVSITVYGGTGIYSDKEVENKDPEGNYRNGNILARKIFGFSSKYDDKWYTFGPFNPAEGELKPDLGGLLFKVIVEGTSGDDGNLYQFYFSTEPDRNNSIEGGNAFTFEYSFRLNADPGMITHIYPFVNSSVVAVKQHNFDFDNDCYIRIVSIAKKGVRVRMSNEGVWAASHHKIEEREKNTSLDLQMIKTGKKGNNNVVFYMTNQYGEYLPFYSLPIGGVPKYNYQIGVKQISRN